MCLYGGTRSKDIQVGMWFLLGVTFLVLMFFLGHATLVRRQKTSSFYVMSTNNLFLVIGAVFQFCRQTIKADEQLLMNFYN